MGIRIEDDDDDDMKSRFIHRGSLDFTRYGPRYDDMKMTLVDA